MRLRAVVLAVLAAACSAPVDPATDAGADADRLDAGGALDASDAANCEAPDRDGDGHRALACGGDDCDDSDPLRYPGNVEVCDIAGHDEDCDDRTFGVRDADADGYPDAACCNASGTPDERCGTDCDDASAAVHPTEAEICNERDDDCDGAVDEEVAATYYLDVDRDGFGVDADAIAACAPSGDHRATEAGDCDDGDPARHPRAIERCALPRDEDCDATTDPFDGDGDGYDDLGCGGDDCIDTDPAIHPGAADHCASFSSDCLADYPEDPDGDGHLAIGETCTGGPLGALPRDDCDDNVTTITPMRAETCDGRDNDCDWIVDEGLTACVPPPDVSAGHTGSLGCPDPSSPHTCTDGTSGSCVAAAAACPATQPRRYECDGAGDCAEGEQCCLTATGASACSPAGTCTGAIACAGHEQCAVGSTCTALRLVYSVYSARLCTP